jgi:hypothetical protein
VGESKETKDDEKETKAEEKEVKTGLLLELNLSLTRHSDPTVPDVWPLRLVKPTSPNNTKDILIAGGSQ